MTNDDPDWKMRRVRDELEQLLLLEYGDELWIKLVAIGPYALPIVLKMTWDMTFETREAFIKFLVEGSKTNVFEPKHQLAYDQLAQ